jgi:putative ABC transport system permease protein
MQLFSIENPEDIIGKKVKLRVFVTNPESGQTQEVTLNKEYEVKSVTNEAAAIVIKIPLPELESQVAVPYYERVQVKVGKSDQLNVVQEDILKRGFIVTALSKTVEQANKIFQGVQMVLACFGGIALIVSAIGMFNTMTVTLLERTNEIGIMRTIGASPRDIKILFLAESVVVGFLGGVIGMLIGVTGGLLLNLTMNLVASHFGGVAVKLFRFPFLFLSFITLFSAIVGFVTGIFPARRAAKLSPLEAIRYK